MSLINNFKEIAFWNQGNQKKIYTYHLDSSKKSGENRGNKKVEKDIWLPMFSVSKIIVFPSIVTPLHLTKEDDITFFKKAYKKDQEVAIIASKNNRKTYKKSDFYAVGTSVKVLKVLMMPDGNHIAVLQGKNRFKLLEIAEKSSQVRAKVAILEHNSVNIKEKKVQALIASIREVTSKILGAAPEKNRELKRMLESIQDPLFLIYYIAANISSFSVKQSLLAIRDSKKRAEKLLSYLVEGFEFNKLKEEIQYKVHSTISQEQKNFFLKKHIQALQNELGEDHDSLEIAKLYEKAKKQKWTKEVEEHFTENMEQMSRMQPHSSDYATYLRYLNVLVNIPWGIYTKDTVNLAHAQKELEESHYGMKKVKERLLEFLAVHALKNGDTGISMCLVGPPGVGKTTIVASIAKALGRKLVKVSLAGIYDEAKLLGHRKTYVAAMLGNIMAGIQKAGSANPIILLDEIDKMDYVRSKGPDSILPILDPSQQNDFVDNYLEVPFDLSGVLFIATANDINNISWPLHDRLEFIEIEGYTTEEKLTIAQKYLFPKQRKTHGLAKQDVQITLKALKAIIESYTAESGVRELSRQLATICRKVAKKKLMGESYLKHIKLEQISSFLGPEKFDQEYYQKITKPGVAIGLSWSEIGGSILFIETSASRGKGEVTVSGQLGKVMEESAFVALSIIKEKSSQLGIDDRIFSQYDLHIHSSPGTISKEGPSAGITLLSALASLYTQKNVKDKVALTGEVTLRGTVLPVGGIKKKVLAAKNAGIKEIILSIKNKKDIEEIDANYRKGMVFHYVENIEQVLNHILEKKHNKQAIQWKLVEQEEKINK
ncbi:MAG: endopeptidase La [Bacteroidota bacterium]